MQNAGPRSVEGSWEHCLSDEPSARAPETRSGPGILLLRVTGPVHGAFSSHEAETDLRLTELFKTSRENCQMLLSAFSGKWRSFSWWLDLVCQRGLYKVNGGADLLGIGVA